MSGPFLLLAEGAGPLNARLNARLNGWLGGGLLAALLLVQGGCTAGTPVAPLGPGEPYRDATRFEKAVARFEAIDAKQPPVAFPFDIHEEMEC